MKQWLPQVLPLRSFKHEVNCAAQANMDNKSECDYNDLRLLEELKDRYFQRQVREQIGNWSEVDDETIEAMNPDEWRI